MAKQIKIIEQDYYNKNDIQIEISEDIIVPAQIKKTVYSVGGLLETIDFLNSKKAKFIEEIDAEIKMNQDILNSMQNKIDKIEIKEPLRGNL